LVLITHVYHNALFKERKDCGKYSGYINVFCFCILHNVWNVVRSPHSLNPDGDDLSAYVANCICGRNFPSRTKWNLIQKIRKFLKGIRTYNIQIFRHVTLCRWARCFRGFERSYWRRLQGVWDVLELLDSNFGGAVIFGT